MSRSNYTTIISTILAGFAGVYASYAQTAIPASYAMPAGSVDTTKPGFLVRLYMTDATHGGTLAWAEDQLAGLQGPNTADLAGTDANGYDTVTTVVNWNGSVGSTVDTFPASDAFPGIDTAASNFTEEVLTYIEFPSAGVYTMGVNSDDGFGVSTALLNPKDHFSAISLGKLDGTRGSADSLFNISVAQAGIYPFRLVFFQVGGGQNLSWFTVITNSTSTNYVLINDRSTPGALKAYAKANIAPPYTGSFVYSPAGFTFTIKDDVTSLVASSLQVKLNGNAITVTNSKAGNVTTVSYLAPTLFPAGTSNTVTVQFSDNAQPPNNESAIFSFIEPSYTVMPASAALTSADVDKTQSGFLYRVNQIDFNTYGVLAANVAHAEAQLAGKLTDPATGNAYPNIATAGTQPDGSYVVPKSINFTFDTTTEQGFFTTANSNPDASFPGITATSSENMAGEIVAYLDLQPGYYNFGVNATDGFRLTTAANAYDALGVTLGLFDYRAGVSENQFGVAVQTAGIYPIRLVWYKMTADAAASIEFYTINSDGTRSLVNNPNDAKAIKAYWKRTSGTGTYLKYAGPSSFVSPFVDSSDVGFKTVNVVLADGTNKVDATTVSLSIDGKTVATNATTASGLTSLSYTPTNCQLPRIVHTAKLNYADVGGATHTATWNFHLLRNYVLPTALYYEDFESTAAGPDPTVPTGWVQENYTGHQDAGNDPANLNSDFYLGWVVVDKSFNITKDFGVSAFAPQTLNGVDFNEDSNPLLVNHYLRAETDSRQNGPPGQIQYITTKAYDLTGKTGVVIAFDSSYEQNQDNINGLEYTTDGTHWNPVFYWVQGDAPTADIYRDGVGNVDAVATMLTPHGDVAQYTDTNTQQLVGGYYGFFIKAPITQALAPYIEGRRNDDGTESKRFEVYSVPLADNQKSVQFRFIQAGTSSWYWAIDNLGIYSVPSLVVTPPITTAPKLSVANAAGTLNFTWTGGTGSFQLQKRTDLISGTWQNVGTATSSGSATDTMGTNSQSFYRLISQ